MANCCEYKVKVKGKKNACYAFYGSMSWMDYKGIDRESGNENDYEMVFSGDTKWSVDSYCDNYEGEVPVKIPDDAEAAYQEAESKYMYYTVEDRARMFDVDVWCNSRDVDNYDEDEDGNPIYDEIFECYGDACDWEVPEEIEFAEEDWDDEDEEDWDDEDEEDDD